MSNSDFEEALKEVVQDNYLLLLTKLYKIVDDYKPIHPPLINSQKNLSAPPTTTLPETMTLHQLSILVHKLKTKHGSNARVNVPTLTIRKAKQPQTLLEILRNDLD